MSDPPTPPPSGELQFETAEPAEGAAEPVATCTGCGQPILSTYYAAGDKVVCPACRDRYVEWLTGGSAIGRLAKATALGALGGLVGAAIWYGVRVAMDADYGIVAIVVGLLVGGAVRMGSGGRGGRAYQVLAVLLTYCAVCASYVPHIISDLRESFGNQQGIAEVEATSQPASQPSPATAAPDPSQDTAGPLTVIVAYLAVFVLSLALPFMGDFGPMGLIIIAIALWEAWVMNSRRVSDLAGPYELSATGAPSSPPPMAPGTP